MECVSNFCRLPAEILSRIITCTDPKSLLPLRSVNHKLRNFTDDPTTLRTLVIYSQQKWERKMNPVHSLDVQKLSSCLGSNANLWLRFAMMDAVAFDYVQSIEKNWIEELFPGEEETRYSCPPLPSILERHAHLLLLFQHPVVSNRHFAMNLAKRGLNNVPSDLAKLARSLIFITSIFLVSPEADLWPSSGLYALAANAFRIDIYTVIHGPKINQPALLRIFAITAALCHSANAAAEQESPAEDRRVRVAPPRLRKMPFYDVAFAKEVIDAMEADERQQYRLQALRDVVGNDIQMPGDYVEPWSRLLSDMSSRQADPVELTRGSWAGFYTGWGLHDGAARPSDFVDPLMTGIRFEADEIVHTLGEEDSYDVRGSGQDEVGTFTLQGYVKMNGEGRLRKLYSSHSWDWTIWVTGWGIFGLWGQPEGDSPFDRTEHRWRDDIALGFLWMWNRAWEEPMEESSTCEEHK